MKIPNAKGPNAKSPMTEKSICERDRWCVQIFWRLGVCDLGFPSEAAP